MNTSSASPSHVDINGVLYGLASGSAPYEEWTVPRAVRGDVTGTSRPAKQADQTTLEWVLDNWSGGEGVKVYDSSRDDHKTMYQTSDAAVDISTLGQLKLGIGTATSLAAVDAANSGPLLTVTNGHPWVVYEGSAQERTTSPDTWTSRSLTGITQACGIDSIAGEVYVGDATNGQIYKRSASSGPTQVTSTAGYCPILTQAALWSFVFDGTANSLKLQKYNLIAAPLPAAASDQFALQWYLSGRTILSPPVSYGANIFWIIQSQGEPRLYVFDGTAGTERKRFPRGFALHDTTTPARSLAVMNDTVFIAGYYSGVTADTATVHYVDSRGFSGELGIIRSGTNLRAVSVNNTQRNELLIGMSDGSVFRYDMLQGSLSLFANTVAGWSVMDSQYSDGYYYFGLRKNSGTTSNVRVDRSSNYVSQSTVTHPLWDFDYPNENKVIYEVQVNTETLATGTSVEVQLVLDGTSTVTTDINGATMAHTSGTKSTFRLSQTAKYVQPKIVLKTTDTTATPSVLSVSLRASITSTHKYYKAVVDCSDDEAGKRLPGSQMTGAYRAGVLRTLRDAGGSFTFKPIFRAAPSPHPRDSSVSKTVIFSPDHERSFYLVDDEQGNGTVQLILKEL